MWEIIGHAGTPSEQENCGNREAFLIFEYFMDDAEDRFYKSIGLFSRRGLTYPWDGVNWHIDGLAVGLMCALKG